MTKQKLASKEREESALEPSFNRLAEIKANNKSHFIAGIFDYRIFSKKAIRENIESGFFDRIVKSVGIHSNEIVALFTCLRLEIYAYSNDKDKLSKIREIFLRNRFKVLFGKEDIMNHLIELCSGKLSEIIAELQIEKQVINTFESQLEKRAKLKELYQIALTNAVSFRKEKNFYNNENYATAAFEIMNDLIGGKMKGLLVVGTGAMSKEFVKVCNHYREKTGKVFITGPHRQKARNLKNILATGDIEIIDLQQINNVIKRVDVIFAAAGGKYKIYRHVDPLLVIDLTCPPMFNLEKCPKTKIITMYDKIYKAKINQINDTFRYKLKWA